MTMIVVCAGVGLTCGAAAASEQKVSPSAAHITMPEARATALKARPGEITDAELERERGGSGLRYSFDIKTAGKTFEVGGRQNRRRSREQGRRSQSGLTWLRSHPPSLYPFFPLAGRKGHPLTARTD